VPVGSFNKCVDEALSAGKISKDVADHIKKAQDPETAINELVGNLTRQKRETAIQSVRMAEAWENINKHGGTKYDGLIALMTKDPTGRAGYNNIEYLGRYYSGKYHSRMADALSRFRTRNIGLSQDQEG